MADFRKWLYTFAVIALLAGIAVPASAQSTLTCQQTGTVPTAARYEGYTELMGDIVITCTGGVPTPAGQPVPQINLQVLLTQNVTSKVTAVVGSPLPITFLEALLIVDEPNSQLNPMVPINNCGSNQALDNTGVGNSGPGICTIISAGPVAGSSPNTYNGTTGHPNVFQGRLGTIQNPNYPSSVVFSGVPFDPPGTVTRTLRITNIRANANGALIAGGNLTSSINASILVTGSQGFVVNPPGTAGTVVAYVQRGLVTGTGSGATGVLKSILSFAQCNATNPNAANQTFAGTGLTSTTTPTIRFVEGFNNAWKVRSSSLILANGTYSGVSGTNSYTYNGGLNNPADFNQNVPGINYNAEAGFNFANPSGTPNPNPPPGFGAPATTNLANGNLFSNQSSSPTNIAAAGLATQGTRLAVSIANAPLGANLFVPPVIYLYRQGTTYTSPTSPGSPIAASGVMVLVSTDSAGNGAYNPVNLTSATLQQVSLTNNAGLVVYEILFEDPSTLEYADVPFVVSYTPSLATQLPQFGVTATAAAGFAPFYTGLNPTLPQQTSSYPIPRFVFTGSPQPFYAIVQCACNLLFPWVTQAPGYDTGIAIANTTSDPFGTQPQQGPVKIWLYGSLANGGAVPATPFCTNTANPGVCPGTTVIPSGQVLTFTLYNGSTQWGLPVGFGAGFSGYLITQASFQYCHGFAFISALGANTGLSEGYLALVLDPWSSSFNRGTPAGEVLGN